MTKVAHETTIISVVDSTSGRLVTVKGAGALKGKMTISKKVDLTKPISVRSPGANWTPKSGKQSGKSSNDGSSNRVEAKR